MRSPSQLTDGRVDGDVPRVSVCIITHNHVGFIDAALASVVEQLSAFRFEVIVGDDASTDGTLDRLRDYQRRFPDIVRVIAHTQRQGIAGNLASTLGAARGEYVALLEGDDFWTSTQKLQRQADLLDARIECVLTFHPVRIQRDATSPQGDELLPTRPPGTYRLQDLLTGNFIPTGAMFFRRAAFTGFPPWLHGQRLVDWPLAILLARHGTVEMTAETMGVYRIHPGGVWSSRSRLANRLEAARTLEHLQHDLSGGARQLAREALCRLHQSLAWDLLAAGNVASARAHARRCLMLPSPQAAGLSKLAVLTATHLPRVMRILRRARRSSVFRRTKPSQSKTSPHL